MTEWIKHIIYEPWPWYVGGPLIGIFVFVFLKVGRKPLGISSSFEYICSVLPEKSGYMKENRENGFYQFYFIIGMIAGGLILNLSGAIHNVAIDPQAAQMLSQNGIEQIQGYVPAEIYALSLKNVFVLLGAGLLIGFGSRYGNGCTAGHAIMGCAQLAPASLIATTCFFIGGLISAWFLVPLILSL